MRDLITIIERLNSQDADVQDDAADELMSFWGLASHFGVAEFKSKFDDAVIGWINRNTRGTIDKLVTNKKAKVLSMLRLWMNQIGQRQYGEPFATPDDFIKAQTMPITLWRGGGGVYDPTYSNRGPWVSFTASERRVKTFSEYDGTRAVRSYVLPTRKVYWITELTIPLNKILLYLPNGNDEEVIIPTELAKTAKLITQVKPDA